MWVPAEGGEAMSASDWDDASTDVAAPAAEVPVVEDANDDVADEAPTEGSEQ